jgi:Zn-finger nucleic acid-binding protein
MADRGTPGKGSSSEEEYFVREDAEKKRRLALQAKKEKDAQELKALKDLHWMHCPKCGMNMQEVKFRGMDVDVCFSCNGIFLDQGELEHIEKTKPEGAVGAVLNWFKPETKKPV